MNAYPSVLYVEDDPMSRAVMNIILVDQMKLTRIALFEDSTRFAERLAQLEFVPDIVFLDIHMKPMNGFQMLEILRSKPEYENKPIVALTASVMNEEVEQLKAARFNGVIAKPILLDSFPTTMQQFLEGQSIWQITRAR